MVDRTLAGNGTLGSFTPIQLIAGEAPVITDRAKVKAGLILDQYTVLALDADDLLVPWNPDLNGVGTEYAAGTLTFSTAVPAANDTVTINGVVFTFKAAAPNAANHEVLIGGTLAATATLLAAAITAAVADTEVVASATGAVVTLRSEVPGAGANAITLAKNFATAGNMTLSGATLSSGVTVEGRAAGIILHAMDTSASGTNEDTFAPYYVGGFFNHEALSWPASVTTLAARRAAFLGTPIHIGSVL